jgi:hypothetical protein
MLATSVTFAYARLHYAPDPNFMDTDDKLAVVAERALTTISDSGGIPAICEAFYLHSILYPARRSLASFERLSEITDPLADAEPAISIAQEAIGHAAALSRFFWPGAPRKDTPAEVKKLHRARARKLRKAFALTRESALARRHLRDTWEHFDERLDLYLLLTAGGLVFPEPIIDTHELADDPLGHVFKLLDPEAECLVLLGQKHFYGPIRAEVRRVHDQAVAFFRNGGRIPQ